MYKVKILVTLRESILDPAGSAVKASLHKLGHSSVENVRIGKYIILTLKDIDMLETKVKEMCETLLANTVMEDYTFTIEEITEEEGDK